ncbi:MAG: hypothetical protein R3C13_07180 [Hyphomonas sp.]|uniref:hypothetical protein n=1 Tax=Hyphomonas sp. TaxID=87 RepID=UPI003529A85C
MSRLPRHRNLISAVLMLPALGACTTEDLDAFAQGMSMAADEMAVTMTMVPQWSCGYNVDRNLVCDDNGDGYADRYGDPLYDTIQVGGYGSPYAGSGVATRINDYGEAYVYEADCDCWVREPSLDEFPDDRGHGHHSHHDDDDWDDD